MIRLLADTFAQCGAAELGPVFSTIVCSEGSQTRWIDRVPGRAVCVVGNESYCAVGIHNGDLLILSGNGRRLFPCIGMYVSHPNLALRGLTCCFVTLFVALGSPISVMECSVSDSPYLLVILITGELKIWDLAERRLVLSSSIEAITNVRLACVLPPAVLLALTSCSCCIDRS